MSLHIEGKQKSKKLELFPQLRADMYIFAPGKHSYNFLIKHYFYFLKKFNLTLFICVKFSYFTGLVSVFWN